MANERTLYTVVVAAWAAESLTDNSTKVDSDDKRYYCSENQEAAENGLPMNNVLSFTCIFMLWERLSGQKNLCNAAGG